jgi:hypothetical protein
VPALLLAWWLLRRQYTMWREMIWNEAGAAIMAIAEQVGGEVRPFRTGYRVVRRGDQRVKIDWWAGVFSIRTRLVCKKNGKVTKRKGEGLKTSQEVAAWLSDAG